ncbi:hypothetical protein CC80DRAFT_569639 [Byssothecium circinans]|uniref:Uncharacterized protein n=1 Tax=Byssothecium circinans TaxID=147558 RepID=A0A6A5TNC0_9PLEO|nr:hypothetical protein CC80DRAFT_569639 [Byssothecium circinans]
MPQHPLARFTISILLSNLPSQVAAHPFDPRASTPSNNTSLSPQCSFPGNADIYGPGIRIGIYTQTLAVYLSKYFIISQSPIIRDSLTIFTVAFVIVSFVFASHPSSLQIVSWNCLTGVRTRSAYFAGLMRDRWIKNASLQGMSVVAMSVHCWYWWRGMDRMKSVECGDRTFFFANVGLRGWFRVMMKVMIVIVEYRYVDV